MAETQLTAPKLYSSEHPTTIITAGGLARSGKGTSMANLKSTLEEADKQVVLIDQGIKFRAMAEVAIRAGQALDGPAELNSFIQSSSAQEAMLSVLSEVATMSDKEKKERLYTPDLSKASGMVGRVASSHTVAVDLLRSQVIEAVESETDVILIDGRSIEKYALEFRDRGIARFGMGWFFKCDTAIAARRSLQIFGEYEDLTTDERNRLLKETLDVSRRNESDTRRTVDPLLEPKGVYHLDLLTYGSPGSDIPFKRAGDIRKQRSIAVVDTSYTSALEEMTEPVTDISMRILQFSGVIDSRYFEKQRAESRS
jgi:cytidylate kinase